jgi:hypothetical protein
LKDPAARMAILDDPAVVFGTETEPIRAGWPQLTLRGIAKALRRFLQVVAGRHSHLSPMSIEIDRSTVSSLVRWPPVAILLLCLSTLAGGQANGAAGGNRLCPGRAISRLTAALTGTWSVQWRYGAAGTIADSAQATISPINAGCAVQIRLAGMTRSGPKSVTAIMAGSAGGVDSVQVAVVDSNHGMLRLFAGTVGHDSTRVEWRNQFPTHVQVVQIDYVIESNNAFSARTKLSADGGATWAVVDLARYVRQRE